MICALDNTFLTLLLNRKAVPRPNPATGEPIDHHRERIESLIDDLSVKRATLIVPAPALAECFCSTETPEVYLNTIEAYTPLEVMPFDTRAAYELSQIERRALRSGDKRSGQVGNWQHVKMDRAIVAIAVVNGASTFYTDDDRQGNYAKIAGLSVVHTWDLPISPKWAQSHMQEMSDQQWPEQKKPSKSSGSGKPPEN